jgi:hypothetical protein
MRTIAYEIPNLSKIFAETLPNSCLKIAQGALAVRGELGQKSCLNLARILPKNCTKVCDRYKREYKPIRPHHDLTVSKKLALYFAISIYVVRLFFFWR